MHCCKLYKILQSTFCRTATVTINNPPLSKVDTTLFYLKVSHLCLSDEAIKSLCTNRFILSATFPTAKLATQL